MSLLRTAIFDAKDIPSELVTIPEWNVAIEVRGMTGADRTRILDTAVSASGKVDLAVVYPEIVIGTCYDPDTGERVFESGDKDAILSKSAQAIDRLAQVGMRLSGFTDEAADEAGKRFPDAPASSLPV